MKLFYSPGACSMSVHIVLNEIGKPFEAVKIDKANKPAEMLKANPNGHVPTVILDDGKALTEAAVILQYLADANPEKNLGPKPGTWERVKLAETMNFLATDIHKGFGPLWAADRWVTNKEGNAELRKSVAEGLSKKFEHLAGRLKDKQFLMGDSFTVADAYLTTLLSWTRMLNVDLSKWPALMGYVERMMARPSVQATMKAEGLLK